MNRRALMRGSMLAGLAATALAFAGDPPAALDQRLRAARPEILRWQTAPLDARAAERRETDIVAIGGIGARTPVRYADGHVAWFTRRGHHRVGPHAGLEMLMCGG